MSNAVTARKKGGFLAGTANYLDERVGVAGVARVVEVGTQRLARPLRGDRPAKS